MTSFAVKYSGAALPPKMQARGATGSRPSSAISRYISITRSAASSWRLYSWMRFTWTSNSVSGSSRTPVDCAITPREPRLVGALHVAEGALELGVGRVRLELAQRLEVALPAVADARA